jgi:16S rRNA (cytosine1402-N4)-methyltransferase
MDRGPEHEPVLRDEVVRLLAPAGRNVLVDCTIGLGGHAEALLEAAGKDALLIGLDVDDANLRRTKQRLSRFADRLRLFQANFSELQIVLAEVGVTAADAILADLGVASSQLDDPARGFAFSVDGPLDMRMDPRIEQTAADLVNGLSAEALADLIYRFGQERYSRQIARGIVLKRQDGRITRTAQLVDAVLRAIPPAVHKTRWGVHPATRTFQALRIAVNDELANLDRLLASLPGLLAPGGRAAVISFHSLEDRRVKNAFTALGWAGTAIVLTKKPTTASAVELSRNPRSRSARLRGIERIA